MRNPWLRGALCALLSATILLLGQASARGYLLCLEPDGQMAIEIPYGGSTCPGCTTDCRLPALTVNQSAAISAGCPCIDLRLGSMIAATHKSDLTRVSNSELFIRTDHLRMAQRAYAVTFSGKARNHSPPCVSVLSHLVSIVILV